jgi:peroxiredoxin
MSKLIPRQPVPSLTVQTLSGKKWRIEEQKPERFTLIVFYRGLHCPVCRSYVSELNRLAEEFEQKGVAVIAISSDTLDRAKETLDTWRLKNLEIGYGLDLKVAYQWGLFCFSQPRQDIPGDRRTRPIQRAGRFSCAL